MFLNVLGYGVLAGAATIAGTMLILYRYEWARHNSIHLMSFAAGSFIYIAAADLIPETHKEEKRFNTVVLIAGMAVLYFVGRLLSHGH